jgi:hypothetical protein
VAPAFGRVAAGQADQGLLDVALDFDLRGACGLRLVFEGGQEAFRHEALAHAGHGAQADGGPLGNVRIVVAVVGEQEDAGVREFACGDLALAQQGIQSGPLVGRQADTIFVHRCTRLLAPVATLVRQ